MHDDYKTAAGLFAGALLLIIGCFDVLFILAGYDGFMNHELAAVFMGFGGVSVWNGLKKIKEWEGEIVNSPPKCTKCNDTGEIKLYHGSGDPEPSDVIPCDCVNKGPMETEQ